MAKHIIIDQANRVSHVFDTKPTDALGNITIEVSNDSVAIGWYYDTSASTLHQYKPMTIQEVREERNKALADSDWMVLADSPYQAADKATNLTEINTWRQQLRDYPDEDTTYTENNFNLPELTLS